MTARPTLGLLLKYVDDIERVRGPMLDELIGVAANA